MTNMTNSNFIMLNDQLITFTDTGYLLEVI